LIDLRGPICRSSAARESGDLALGVFAFLADTCSTSALGRIAETRRDSNEGDSDSSAALLGGTASGALTGCSRLNQHFRFDTGSE
jgi:hypothetical protein